MRRSKLDTQRSLILHSHWVNYDSSNSFKFYFVYCSVALYCFEPFIALAACSVEKLALLFTIQADVEKEAVSSFTYFITANLKFSLFLLITLNGNSSLVRLAIMWRNRPTKAKVRFVIWIKNLTTPMHPQDITQQYLFHLPHTLSFRSQSPRDLSKEAVRRFNLPSFRNPIN